VSANGASPSSTSDSSGAQRRGVVRDLGLVGIGDVAADRRQAVGAGLEHALHRRDHLVACGWVAGLMHTRPAISGCRPPSRSVSEPPMLRPATTTFDARAARR
jgi:hypothetical protein